LPLSQQLTQENYLVHHYTQYQTIEITTLPSLIILGLLDSNYEKIHTIKDSLITHFDKKSLPPLLAYIDVESKNKQQLFEFGMIDYISYPPIKQELSYRIQQIFSHTKNLPVYSDSSLLHNQFEPLINNKQTIDADANLAERTASHLLKNIDDEIKLSSLSREMATNRNKLSHTFKAYFGCTIFLWLRKQRMLRAAELLLTSSHSILQIAEQVGYLDSNNFSTAFKKTMGKSPRQYRQSSLVGVKSAKKLVPQIKVLISEDN